MPARSATRPIRPSSASSSRTRWPLPRPPIAGLQDIAPTVAKRWVTSATLAPMRAAAAAASQPAWPPPTTTTSYCRFIVPNSPSAELLADRRQSVHFTSDATIPGRVSRETSAQLGREGRPLAQVVRCARLTPLCGPLFADKKTPEDHVENILHVHPPQKFAQCPGRQAKLLCHDFLPAVLRGALRALQREHGFPQMGALALARHQSGLWREEVLGKARHRVNQFINTGTCLAGNKVNNFFLIECRFNSSLLLLCHQIHFIDHQPGGGFGCNCDCGKLQRLPLARTGVHDPKHQVRADRLLARAPHALAFDWIVGFANAGGVDRRHRIAGE